MLTKFKTGHDILLNLFLYIIATIIIESYYNFYKVVWLNINNFSFVTDRRSVFMINNYLFIMIYW